MAICIEDLHQESPGSEFGSWFTRQTRGLPRPLVALEPVQLVNACLAQRPGAWDEFIRRYRPHIKSVATRTLRQVGVRGVRSAALDVVSEVFADLLAKNGRALRNFREPYSMEGWLTVVTRRKVYRYSERSRRHMGSDEIELENVVQEGSSPVSEFGRVEQRDQLAQQLERLSERDQQLLKLFYQGGRSYKEVAEILNVPPEHVGTFLARARKRLAKFLGPRAR